MYWSLPCKALERGTRWQTMAADGSWQLAGDTCERQLPGRSNAAAFYNLDPEHLPPMRPRTRAATEGCAGGPVKASRPASKAVAVPWLPASRGGILRAQHPSPKHRARSPHAHFPQRHTAMPSSDYTAAAGGALKLKGSGVDKKKKKKKPKPTDAARTAAEADADAPAEASKTPSGPPARAISPSEAEDALKEAGGRQKTEAEKRHEEMRRKRLEDRLKREGVKTHKERVEELNKYLSGLSEHHDMPKIGPG